MHRARFCNSCVFRQARSGSMPTRIFNMCRRFPRSTESACLSFLREPPPRFGCLRFSVLLSFVNDGIMAARNIVFLFKSRAILCAHQIAFRRAQQCSCVVWDVPSFCIFLERKGIARMHT